MTPLERITARVTRHGHPDDPATPRPLLTLAEFFDGNDVVGSIGCNLPTCPEPGEFRRTLEQIAARPEVHDIRVMVTYFDAPEWPFSDTVYVMATASAEEVNAWFDADLRPDNVSIGFDDRLTFEPYEVPAGTRPVACWWD